jgi:formylglycine-generating enzyme
VLFLVGRVVSGCLAGAFLLAACSARELRPTPALATLESKEPASLDLGAPFAMDASPPVASGASDASLCPAEMVLVEGDYCPQVRQTCKRWLDGPGPYHEYRCGEYAPSECLAPRVHKRFCIDREEYVKPGDALPLAHQSWTSAGAICTGRDARLCLESEWQFACEGEEMRPYPYGLVRDSTACNIDQMNLGKPQAGLNDLRAPVDAYPRCLSPFGVHDMSGNVEEWATLDNGKAPDRSAMKGAWWLPGKNTCRAATLGHGEIYEGPQVGVRCCRDPSPASPG